MEEKAPADEAKADSESPSPASGAAPVDKATPTPKAKADSESPAPASDAEPVEKAAPAAEAKADSESTASDTGGKAGGAKRKKSTKRKKR